MKNNHNNTPIKDNPNNPSTRKKPITLLEKSGWHVWKDLDDYRFITLLNTELQILARALTNRLQLVISNLIGPEQNYAVMGRSIQHNLHLVREVIEGLQDNTKTALVYLDQSKAFDRADHLFWKQFWRTPDSNRGSANG